MMPLRFFRIPAFSAGNSVAFSIALGMFATFFFLTLYMQNIKGYSPFQAGASFLPLTVMIIVTAPYAGKYASRARLAGADDLWPGARGRWARAARAASHADNAPTG